MDFNNSFDQGEVIKVPTESRFHLEKASSYSRGLSILGLILAFLLGIVSLGLIFGGSFMSNFIPGIGSLGAGLFMSIGLFFLVLVGVYVFLMIKLLRFASLANSSIMKESNEELEQGLKELKTFFKGYSILVIVLFVSIIMGGIIFGGILMSSLGGLNSLR